MLSLLCSECLFGLVDYCCLCGVSVLFLLETEKVKENYDDILMILFSFYGKVIHHTGK